MVEYVTTIAVGDELLRQDDYDARIPRAIIESCPQELFTAIGYPETVTTTARMIQQRRAGP
jgi:hypothetical protein